MEQERQPRRYKRKTVFAARLLMGLGIGFGLGTAMYHSDASEEKSKAAKINLALEVCAAQLGSVVVPNTLSLPPACDPVEEFFTRRETKITERHGNDTKVIEDQKEYFLPTSQGFLDEHSVTPEEVSDDIHDKFVEDMRAAVVISSVVLAGTYYRGRKPGNSSAPLAPSQRIAV